MMSDLYYVVSALPPLSFGNPPEMRLLELLRLLEMNLTVKEMEAVHVLLRLVDIYHIAALWRGEPFESEGGRTAPELEEALSSGEGLPQYVYSFEETYESKEAKLRHFGALATAFFREELPKAQGFLRAFLEFERSVRLVTLALRAKSLGRDVTRELQFEDSGDDLVAQIIAQRDARSYEPPEEFGALRTLFEEHGSDPRAFQQALQAYRFRQVQEMVSDTMFSLDYVLGYVVRLMIIEKQQELQKRP